MNELRDNKILDTNYFNWDTGVYCIFIFVLMLILNLIKKPYEDRITFLELNEKVLAAIISGFFDIY